MNTSTNTSNVIHQGAYHRFPVDQLTELAAFTDYHRAGLLGVSIHPDTLNVTVIINNCNMIGCTASPTTYCSNCGCIPYCSTQHAHDDSVNHTPLCLGDALRDGTAKKYTTPSSQ